MCLPESIARNGIHVVSRNPVWLPAIRIYLGLITVGNLAWEVAHVPLYTIWQSGSAREIGFAVFHCTVGDVLIATACLVMSLLLMGASDWPRRSFKAVAVLAVVGGVAYTVYSEWLNTTVRQSWAYNDWMPVLPLLGTGLSPLLQWLIIPSAAFIVVHRRLHNEASAR